MQPESKGASAEMSAETPAAIPFSTRLLGVIFILFGMTFQVFSLVYVGTFLWLGRPTTVTPTRMAGFWLIGLMLASLGYRVASGKWTRVWQVPYYAAAAAGFWFIVLVIKMDLRHTHPMWPPAWMLAFAVAAVSSWWHVARRCRTRRRRHTGFDLPG